MTLPPYMTCNKQKSPQVGVKEWAEQDSNLRPPLCKPLLEAVYSVHPLYMG